MDPKESSKESSKPRQDSILKKVPVTMRKDSERSMKSDGSERSGGTTTGTTTTIAVFGKEKDQPQAPDGAQSGAAASPKVPRRIINNWRHACDKTKDKTKELLKKWRTLPEPGQGEDGLSGSVDESDGADKTASGWSEHVWTTWVKRTPSGDDSAAASAAPLQLTEFQRKKLAHFFISFLDLDRDDVISLADFEAFSERLRHFSDWSKSSTEYNRLREVQRSFVESFLLPEELQDAIHSYDQLEKKLIKEQLSLDQWLHKWNHLLDQSRRNYLQLPLWVQYFPKILFHVINRSGTGIISKDELSAFYASILGLTAPQIDGFVGDAFDALTSNEEQPLAYGTFRLCFANFLMGKHPNGPGQYLFGPIHGVKAGESFPIDYKAMCFAQDELEQYSPAVKTNRRSVIV